MQLRLFFLFAALSLTTLSVYAEDVIILKDGKPMEGTITKETDDTVFIRENNGEVHGIDRGDIARIQRDKNSVAKAPAAPAAQ